MSNAPLPRLERPNCAIRDAVLNLDTLEQHEQRVLVNPNIDKMPIGLNYCKVWLDDGEQPANRIFRMRLTGVYSRFGVGLPKKKDNEPQDPNKKPSYTFSAPERDNMSLASRFAPCIDRIFKREVTKNVARWWPKEFAQCKDDAQREMFVNGKYKSILKSSDDEEKAERYGADLKFGVNPWDVKVWKLDGNESTEEQCMNIRGTYNFVFEIPRLNFATGKASCSPKMNIVAIEAWREVDDVNWGDVLSGEKTTQDNNMHIDTPDKPAESNAHTSEANGITGGKRKREDESSDADGTNKTIKTEHDAAVVPSTSPDAQSEHSPIAQYEFKGTEVSATQELTA